ncbi:MAG: PAS domain S-box protein, partial [Myxococcota bacterium]
MNPPKRTWDEEHREGLQALQVLAQSIDAVVSIDRHNRVVFFNAAAERLWGYSASEVVGQNVKIFVPSKAHDLYDSYVAHSEQTGELGLVGAFRDVVLERKNGRPVRVDVSVSRVEVDGDYRLVAFVRDTSEAFDNRSFIDQTLEQALDAVVIIDEQNAITFFNRAAETLWQRKRADVIGQNVRMLVPVEMQPHHDDFVNANRSTGQDKIVGTSREVEVHRPDGTIRLATLSLSKVRLQTRTKYTAFLRDVTEQVEAREKNRLLSLSVRDDHRVLGVVGNQRQESVFL